MGVQDKEFAKGTEGNFEILILHIIAQGGAGKPAIDELLVDCLKPDEEKETIDSQ